MVVASSWGREEKELFDEHRASILENEELCKWITAIVTYY
jgi:hypothetical protein